jgi:oligosaccharide repeat unit polymerase
MSTRVTIELRRVFSPLALVAIVYVPLLVLFLITSPSVFESEFQTTKHVSITSVSYFTLSLLLFAAGAALGRGRLLRRPLRSAFEQVAPSDTYRIRRLEPFLGGLMLVSVVAYLAWFGVNVVSAGGPTKFFHAWLYSPVFYKKYLLRTIPGVTTLTQLAVAAIPLALAFGLLRRGGKLRGLAVCIVVLGAARSVLFSERLAVFELIVPIAYLLLAQRRITVAKGVLYGLGVGFAILVMFSATELRRTYVYTHNFSASRVTARFFGYYIASVDNGGVVIDHYPAATPFANTLQMLWRFPVAGSIHADHFPVVGTVSLHDGVGKDPIPFWSQAFAQQHLSYEYNTLTTPGFLAADFGWFALPVLFLLGFYSGTLYTRARSSPFHRALYAVWLVGLLEFMRILYFFDTRLLPAYAAFGAVYVSIARRARFEPAVTPVPAGSRPLAAPGG